MTTQKTTGMGWDKPVLPSPSLATEIDTLWDQIDQDVANKSGAWSVSDDGVKVMDGPSDLNFGGGISVTDDLDGTVSFTLDPISEADLSFDPATQAELDGHATDATNPHGVTASQAGAVDTTGDTMTGDLYFSGKAVRDLDRVNFNNSSNDFWYIQDGSGGTNTSPHTARFDDRDLRYYAGGTAGAGTVWQLGLDGSVSYPVGPVTIAGNQSWHAGNFDPATKLDAAGDTMTGGLSVTGETAPGAANAGTTMLLETTSPQLEFHDTDHAAGSAGKRHWLHHNGGNLYFLIDDNDNGTWNSPHPIRIRSSGVVDVGRGLQFGGTGGAQQQKPVVTSSTAPSDTNAIWVDTS